VSVCISKRKKEGARQSLREREVPFCLVEFDANRSRDNDLITCEERP